MARALRFFGVPMDLGPDRGGVDMGPSAIHYAGLADTLETIYVTGVEGGDVLVPNPE